MPKKTDPTQPTPDTSQTGSPAISQTISDSPQDPAGTNQSILTPNAVLTNLQVPKKYGGTKVIATIFGILLLILGVGAGVFLVQREQEIRERAGADTGTVAIFKFMCQKLGEQDVCNSRDTSLGNYKVDFEVHQGENNQGSVKQKITVTISDNNNGQGDVGNASQGRKVGDPLETGTYTVCEIPEAYNDSGVRVSLEVEPRPEASRGGSSGGVNQKEFGENCITVELNPGEAELKYLNKRKTALSADCHNVKAYDTEWNLLTSSELTQLKEGDTVMFAVAGTATTGSFDMAKFTINGIERDPVSSKKPGSDEFYDEYTIPSGTASFTINAQIHHSSLGWF